MGAKDGDSAGTLAYKTGWKIIYDSCAFSNAIRLIVFLITGKLVNFYQNVFCFFKIWFWIVQHDRFDSIIDKFFFVFKEFCCLWVLSPRIFRRTLSDLCLRAEEKIFKEIMHFHYMTYMAIPLAQKPLPQGSWTLPFWLTFLWSSLLHTWFDWFMPGSWEENF